MAVGFHVSTKELGPSLFLFRIMWGGMIMDLRICAIYLKNLIAHINRNGCCDDIIEFPADS